MSETISHKIRINVETNYIEAQSDPGKHQYFFSYTITISNAGTVPARLLSRHWIITDANGQVQEVRGDGVVGEQPYLKPNEGFQYTSGTVLETPVGSMRGTYLMVDDDGTNFDAEIPMFTLSVPLVLH
jgi:ApaG protein